MDRKTGEKLSFKVKILMQFLRRLGPITLEIKVVYLEESPHDLFAVTAGKCLRTD